MTIKTCLILGHNDTYEYREFNVNNFKSFHDLIDGYVEIVNVLYRNKSYSMIVNDEGLIHNLPFNARATAIYHNVARRREAQVTNDNFQCYSDPHQDPRPFIRHMLSPIVGNAILFPKAGNELKQFLPQEELI